jgi:Peptidase M16 inactive domain
VDVVGRLLRGSASGLSVGARTDDAFVPAARCQDSDERACAYIAGAAPSRWAPFGAPAAPLVPPARVVPPPLPPPTASREEIAAAQRIRRAHPLYASVTLSLLTEVVNSRLFTTVRDALGLTYDVSFEVCNTLEAIPCTKCSSL